VLYFFITYGYPEVLPPSFQGNNPSVQGPVTSCALTLLQNGAIPNASLLIAVNSNRYYDMSVPSDLDPITDYFRIQMCCELLNSCGSYFMRGINRLKLEEFLAYFQRYLLLKGNIPFHVEFDVLDMMDNLEKYAADDAKRELKNTKNKNGNELKLMNYFQ
jgi:hypothetical protein